MTKLAVPPGVPLASVTNRLRVPSFGLGVATTDGVSLTTSTRTPITATASVVPATLGAWQEVVAATGFEATFVWLLVLGSTGAAGTDTSSLLSIATGAAGSEVPVVDNLAVGYCQGFNLLYGFPLRIPKGSRVAIALRSIVVSKTCLVMVSFANLPLYTRAPMSLTTMGASTVLCRGVSIPGTTVNTKSAWVEIVASTLQPFGAVMLGVQGDGDLALDTSSALVDVGIGPAGSERVLMADYPLNNDATTERINYAGGPPIVGVHIPAGSRLAVRWSRANTGNSLDAILYGVPLAA